MTLKTRVVGFFKKDGKTKPITKKSGSHRPTSQEHESSWTKSSISNLKKDIPDERDDERAYRNQARHVPTKSAEKTLTSIADDEHEHQSRLQKLLHNPESDKKYLYSTIHRGKVKVTSMQQHKLLEARKLPHTHVYEKDGEIIRERVYA